MFVRLEPDDVALRHDDDSILRSIHGGCTNLRTLTTSLDSTNAVELELDALDSPNVVTEALKLVNAHFRAISSLQEIVVEVFEDGPSDHVRRTMESHGWKFSTTENVEEEDFNGRFSGHDPMDDDYDSDRSEDDYDVDDYDVDNDSDFDRRALD